MGNTENTKDKKGGRGMRFVAVAGISAAVIVIAVILLVNKMGTKDKIYEAIQAGDHAKLEKMLKSVDPKKLDTGRHSAFLSQMLQTEDLTALQYACSLGDLESVRLLVEAGVKVDAPCRSYIFGTPLWYAFNRIQNRDRFKIAKYLIEAGADCTNSDNGDKVFADMMILSDETKKDETVWSEQIDVFRAVYERMEASGVSMTEKYPGLLARAAGSTGTPVLVFLIEQGYTVNPEPDPETGHAKVQTPLCEAAHSADIEAVEYLLSMGADVNLRDMNNKTPLESVIEQKGKVETEDWLKGQRDRLGDYDRVIEILTEAGR